jgi:prolyl oligopeptidase
MRIRFVWAWVGILVALGVAGCGAPKESGSPGIRHADPGLIYPYTPTNNIVEVLHGVPVADPYRWLEDDRAPGTAVWVEAQNRVTFEFLDRIPERARIRARLTQLWDFERHGLPIKRGNRYFYTHNNGLQNQSVLYWTEGLEGEPRKLVDPNTWSADGTIALSGFAVTEDGLRVAYGQTAAGSDWQEWRVREVDSGQDLEDVVRWVKFSSASWTRDGAGFFYSRFDEPAEADRLTALNQFHKVYFHRLGTSQPEDRLVYHRPDQKEWNLRGRVSEDGRFLIIHVAQGTDPRNGLFYLDLETAGGEVIELLQPFEASYGFVDNDGPVFYVTTDLEAPRGRVVAIDVNHPARSAWRSVVPEAEDTLEGVTRVGGRFFLQYLHHAAARVESVDAAGARREEVPLPGLGSASGFGGRVGDRETFYMFSSFTTPPTLFRYDMETGTSEVFRAPRVGFDPAQFETRQVFYRSRDGTRVPMFITHRKGLVPDGQRPTLLYGYGGFRVSLKPSFSMATLVWLELGGVYATPNLRGGGEYGDSWHRAGTKLQKQNTFDDAVAAAEWLILNGYTSSRRLAITGGSNGGLLVGACMTQRPGLFAAALPAVGVLDMLRFHKFTIGWAWTSDYGSPDDPAGFRALLAYSPLHNLRPGTVYPSTLITTADHDDRVVPAHSFKFASALQAAHGGRNPVLIRVETRSGHGAGKPVSKTIEEAADRCAFLVHELGIDVPPDYAVPRNGQRGGASDLGPGGGLPRLVRE